ncbi:MAG: tetratricopeptide repeat protein [Kofleriaceae bacterium]
MDSSAIRRALEVYYKTRLDKPAAALAKLAKLEVLPPAIKKRLKTKPGSPPLDFGYERVTLHADLGYEAFRAADAAYWKHHDPGSIPDQSVSEPWAEATNDALQRAARTGPPKASKRASAPDFSRAKQALAYVIEHGDELPGAVTQARLVLASIALREGKPRDAIRWCEPLSAFHAAPRMAWAYQQLGDREALAAWLARANGPTHKGFLAELAGDDAAAVRGYLEAIATQKLPRWRAYGKLRLRRMEARLGKKTVERLAASIAQEREAGKPEISSIADFHARFADIAAAIRKRENITEPPQPMSEAAIAKLRLRTSRTSANPTVAVPKSVATILRTDKNFRLWKHAQPLLAHLRAVDIEKLVRRALRGEDTGLGPLAKLPANVPLWTDDPEMPACISLASPGDQELFLYMGSPDADGEYPVARFDDQPELWISDASLVHYILDAAASVVTCKLDLAKAKKQAQKRNARFRERFSKHPKVTAILARF